MVDRSACGMNDVVITSVDLEVVCILRVALRVNQLQIPNLDTASFSETSSLLIHVKLVDQIVC